MGLHDGSGSYTSKSFLTDDPLHHPSHALALYEACVAAGGDCTLRTASQQEGREGSYWGMLLDLME